MALTAREIQDAYVTFFNRAADTEGFAYWTSYAGSISDLYATFAQQTEYTSVYGGKSAELQITTVYQNLFNRAPDAEGLAYWKPLVEAGTITLANLALTVNRGAQGTDTTALTGKIDAAIVTTDAAVAANLPGQPFKLTTGADVFTGTDKADTFNADLTTVTDGDTLSGGAGADTLNASLNANVTDKFKTAAIESINFTAFGDRTVDAKNLADVETLSTVGSTGAITVNNLSSSATAFGFSGANTNSITANYAAGALSGVSDALVVKTSTAAGVAVDVDAGFESVTIQNTGKSDINTFTTPGITAITVTGSGSLDFANASIDGTKTLSASAFAGSITTGTVNATTGFVDADIVGSTEGSLVILGSGDDNIGFTGATNATTKSDTVKLGSGNDKVVLNAAGTGPVYVFGEAGNDTVSVATSALTASDLIDGGAGDDTVSMNMGGAHALVLRAVENLELTSTASGAITINSADGALAVTAKTTGGSAVNLIDLSAGSTVDVVLETAASAAAGAVSVGFKSAEAASTIDIVSGMTGALTLGKITNATVNYGAASTLTAAITATDTTTDLTLNATKGLTGTQAVAGNTIKNVTIAGQDAVTMGAFTSTALASLNVTGAKAVTVGAASASSKLASVAITSTADAVALAGAIGAATTTELASVTVSAVKAVTATAGTADIDAVKIGTVSVTSTTDNAAIGNIGDANTVTTIGNVTVSAAKAAAVAEIGDAAATSVGNVSVTGGTTSSVAGTILAKSIGNITVTGGTTANVEAIAAANTNAGVLGAVAITAGTDITFGDIASDGAIGPVTLTATAGKIESDGTADTISAATAAGLDIAMTAKTTIANDAAGAIAVSNSLGDVRATVAGTTTGGAQINYAATTGAVALTATNTGGLTSTVDNGGTAGDGKVSTITLGNAISGTTNTVTVIGTADKLNVTGGTGADVLVLDTQTTTADKVAGGTINLGAGTDKVDFTKQEGIKTAANGVIINLGSTTVTMSDTGLTTVAALSAAEYDASSASAQVVAGGYLFTLNDVEQVVGTDAADYIVANAAGTTITGGAGADKLYGGAGDDTFIVTGTTPDASDIISGGTGNNTMTVTATTNFADTDANITGIAVINLSGTDVGLDLTGQTEAFTINGDTGANTIIGSAGIDTITGGTGIDTITGGAGSDNIVLTEGTAAVDTVILKGTGAIVSGEVNNDTITGFTAGTGGDVLQFGSTWLGGVSFASGSVSEIAAATSVKAAQDGMIVWISDGAGSSYDTAAEMSGLLSADMSVATVEAVIIAGSDNAYVWFYDGGLDGAAAISANDFVLIGVLSGVAANDLVAGNFAAAAVA